MRRELNADVRFLNWQKVVSRLQLVKTHTGNFGGEKWNLEGLENRAIVQPLVKLGKHEHLFIQDFFLQTLNLRIF